MRGTLNIMVVVAGIGLGSHAGAAVIHDEALHGDLSGDRQNPTTYTLQAGTNSLLASTNAGDQEYVTLVVPAGHQLSSVILTSYDSANGIAFIGVQSGTIFTEDPFSADPANLLGWAHFGSDMGQVGQDILDDLGQGFGAQGFIPPLPAGPYTYWIQQFDFDPTAYQFDFIVVQATAAPGDVNNDGSVNAADIAPFVDVLLGLDTNPSHVASADIDDNGTADGRDVMPFAQLVIP